MTEILISDEKSFGSQGFQQRELALASWENEGGSGPPERATADKPAFDASLLMRSATSQGPVAERDFPRIAADAVAAHASARGSRFLAEAPLTHGPAGRGQRNSLRLIKDTPLYPLRFEPLWQYRPWGGRRLSHLLSSPFPGRDPVGEAWLLSDRTEHPSLIADGPLKGETIATVLEKSPQQLLGHSRGNLTRFPLLLKLLDVQKSLSVQVHPSDMHRELIPAGNSGKSEAWVVLETGPEARIYAGLKPATTAEALRQAITNGTVEQRLASFAPKPGDSVFVQAGTVHSLRDVVVFEVQQNSDVTLRLYDWGRIDPETGKSRPLQVNQAMACVDWAQGAIKPATPRVRERRPVLRESLVQCDHFSITRISGQLPFMVGDADLPTVLFCLGGEAHLQYAASHYTLVMGDVLLLPAVVGTRCCQPRGVVSLLEISLPRLLMLP